MTEMYQQREIFEVVNLFLCREHPNKCKANCKAQVFPWQVYLKGLRLFLYPEIGADEKLNNMLRKLNKKLLPANFRRLRAWQNLKQTFHQNKAFHKALT